MEAFKQFTGLVVPLDRPNVDTDAIIPKQFLKSIKRTGFGPNLFDEWRYLDHGQPGQDCAERPLNEEFVFNQPRYEGAGILLPRHNFGCGPSREHAAWAMMDYGTHVVIAPSFADIFYSNAGKNGMLAVVLSGGTVDGLFREVEAAPGYELAVDLEAQTITKPDSAVISFEIDSALRDRLLNGLDDIGISLQYADEIKEYEERRRREAGWLFQGYSV